MTSNSSALVRTAASTGLLSALVAVGCGTSAPTNFSDAAGRGHELVQQLGCATCHDPDGSETPLGPRWERSWNRQIELSDGSRVPFDRQYVISSVRDADRHRRSGDWIRMPTYTAAQLTDEELDDIVAYIEALG